ncbi:MAG: transcriptional regulator, PucR family [Firmicutes bacterium]|nr:transcriptional regulator, PucR family [Bacillota bacterium]
MMLVKVRDIFKLPQLKRLRLVAGAKGLDRTLHWIHVVELPDVMSWVLGGELLFMTGVGIRDNLEVLNTIVKECADKNVAGLVINTGPYIHKTPDKIIKLADGLHFPIFEMPWEVRLVEVTKDICNYIIAKQIEEKSIQDIIENILYGDCSNAETLLTRAAVYGYDLGNLHQVMLIKLHDNLEHYKQNDAFAENYILDVKMRFQQIVQGIVEKNGQKALFMTRSDRIILLLPSNNTAKEKQRLESMAADLSESVKLYLNGRKISIGCGNPYEGLQQLKTSLEQAELALKVAQASTIKRFFDYENLGFFKVLFNVQDRRQLELFRTEVLGKLYEYDDVHHTDLVPTLKTFLEENADNVAVADKLHIHRNTLKYRLKKCTEITEKDFSNSQDRTLLYFAAMVDTFLNL